VQLANAARQKGLAEAEVQRAVTEAINLLSQEQSTLKYHLALVTALPAVIQESVEPMKVIDGIKIVQVDGLNRGVGASNGADGAPLIHRGGGNLAESVIQAALAYRANAPLIDSLLAEVGLNSTSLAGLTKGISDGVTPAQGTDVKVAQGSVPPKPAGH